MKSIVGGNVLSSSVGHGSFIDLKVRTPHEGRLVHLWVYLADWALVKDDDEIVASDMDGSGFAGAKQRLSELEGRMVKRVDFLNRDEAHIGFTGQYRLEIWRPERGGEPGDALVKLFADGRHMQDVVAFDSGAPSG